jgi:signal transduction histidine kinase
MGAKAELGPSIAEPRTRPSEAAGIAGAVAVYLLVVAVAAVLPLVNTRNPFLRVTPEYQAYHVALWLVWLVVLVEALRRQPSGRLAKLIFAYVMAEQIWAFRYIHNSVTYSVFNLLSFLWIPILIHLVLAFPSGRLTTAWDRALAAFYYVDIIVFSLLVALFSQFPPGNCTSDCYQNVFAIWPNDDVVNFLVVADVVIPVLASPLIVWRLWRHWRDASWIGREPLLPVLIAASIVVASVSLQYLGDRLDIQPINAFYMSALQPIPLFVLPIGFLLGVLRLRLNRGRVADLVMELGRGVPVGGLRDVLARTLGDPSLQLVFAAPSGAGFVDAGGRTVELPANDDSRAVTRLEHDSEVLGVLVHDPDISAQNPGLVEAAGAAARLALENERLAAQVRAQLEEVRASRARIVEAGDVERRRIERDLHDGAQQRLVALAMRLQLAKATALGASGLLDEATAELQTAIGEVRDLARGIHPPILTEAGLGAAIEALAERAAQPVTVAVTEARYPATIEATAYFVVAEALTNVARHADATQAHVMTSEEDGQLIVVVKDDGQGGADLTMGSGLRGLQDRLAAAGGTLRVSSPVGHGTTIRAAIPLT